MAASPQTGTGGFDGNNDDGDRRPIPALHPTLSLAERAALHLEAKARGDQAEADRLTRSCPPKVYQQADAAYADRLELAHDKACFAVMIILHHQGKLQTLHAVMNVVGGFAPTWRVAAAMAFFDGMHHADERHKDAEAMAEAEKRGGHSSEPEEDDKAATVVLAKVQAAMDRADEAAEKLRELLKTAAEVVARDLAEALTAFGRFSRECVGVDPDALLAGCGFPPASSCRSMICCLHIPIQRHETLKFRNWPRRCRGRGGRGSAKDEWTIGATATGQDVICLKALHHTVASSGRQLYAADVRLSRSRRSSAFSVALACDPGPRRRSAELRPRRATALPAPLLSVPRS